MDSIVGTSKSDKNFFGFYGSFTDKLLMLWSMNGNHGFKPYFQCFDPALVIDHANTGLFSTWFTNHIDVGVRYVCGNFPKTKSLNVFLIVLSNRNCFIAFRRLRHWQRQRQGARLKRSYFPKTVLIQIQHFCFHLWEILRGQLSKKVTCLRNSQRILFNGRY